MPAMAAGDRLDGRPAHELGALLADAVAVDLGVRLVVAGGEPGPAGQLVGRGEPADAADLGHNDRRHSLAHVVDGLDSAIALVVSQQFVDLPFEQVDLFVEGVDQLS